MVSAWQPLTGPLLVVFPDSYKGSEKMKIHTNAKNETDR